MDVSTQFQQQQLAGLGGEGARPIARVENPPAGARSSSPGFTPGRRGEQLKMFMTPSEIHEGWQALDADRHERGTEEYSSASTMPTQRGTDTREAWQAANPMRTVPTEMRSQSSGPAYGYDTGGNYFNRTTGGGRRTYVETPETDEDLYARKLDEAQGYGDEDEGYEPKMVGGKSSHWSGETYHPATGSKSSWESPMRYTPGEEGMTLHESIGESGVQSPIRLGSEIGSLGKPQVVGGHHRLASATEHSQWGGRGEQFVPVLHHQNIHEARSQPTQRAWKYS